MRGGGESGGEEAEKEEILGEKLARRRTRSVLIRKSSRGGPTTPVLSSWSLFPFGQEQQHQPIIKDALFTTTTSTNQTRVSARKLGAALWEFQNYFPLSKMHRGNHNNGVGAPPPPRQRHHHPAKDKGILGLSNFLADNCPSSPDQPASASNLTRHIAASLMQHHRSIGRNNHLLQPVSPTSCGSSMEVAPYNPAVTPTSSLDFKGRMGESHYNLKTSTELLKVLNRIWSLEEQHTSNIALIKALKAELDNARVKIKDLVRVRQADRHELDDLMKQIGEDKIVRKSKEQDRIHAAVQSVRGELEDERRLRKRSESLHRKLARDLSEVKSSLSNSLIELESERKSRKLLEDLCDEFAKGIKDYEQEVHFLKQKTDEDWTGSSDRDRLILHVSESWLDERMQMQLEQTECGLPRKNSIVDKLSLDIETFLRAKCMNKPLKNTESLLPRDRRKNSLESVPLNEEVVSAPQDAGDEEDSLGSESHCFELIKPSNSDFKLQVEEAVENGIDEKVKTDHSKKKPASSERVRSRTPSSLQVKFEEQMAWALSCGENKKSQVVNSEQGKGEEAKQTEINISQNSEHCEVTEAETYRKGNKQDERHGSNANYMAENHIRNRPFISDGGHVLPENNLNEASCSNTGWRNQASPVRQWMARLTSPALDMLQSSSKLPLRKKENTLKAKLLEARSKGQRSTRAKAFKSTS
ncbi:uncharacterized protein At5g41620 [Argentina anserina]|uniref:uncharacterized protein At5g41620 n=1 Tax=Argentina anserina TaxID=57926 RepID=UPI00217663E6|nr:uncharacterized protein At5g41620 [Potentilla anserina]